MPHDSTEETTAMTPATLEALVQNHREFLRFVERRVGNRALAEEILQEAFVRGLERGEQIRDSVVGWFYGVLRHAVVDQKRRSASADRRLLAFANELESTSASHEELAEVACACILRLADTLKVEYADALRRVEIEGMPVNAYAAANGISASNAGVRIFRAREALKKQVARSCGSCAEHGCLDCSCGSSAQSP